MHQHADVRHKPLCLIRYLQCTGMELDLPSLFGLLCTAALIGGDPATPAHPALGLNEGPVGQPR
jgi:hypothetical protein